MVETKESLEALIDRIDWYGFWFTIAVFAAIGGEAAMHLWYKQANKRLQVVLRAEDDAHAKQLQYARAVAGQRTLDAMVFKEKLKGKPTGNVRILFKREDSEAYMLARLTYDLFGGTGWTVSRPEPIPLEGGDPIFSDEVPSDIRHGAETDVTLLASTVNFRQPNTAEAALRDALVSSRANPIGGVAMVFNSDPSLPENHFIIVIGQKR